MVAPASQFIASRCWRVICCFIPSVCTMGPLWGAEQHPLEFRSNALTSAHPTHRALVSQRRTPSLHPPVLCPPGPSPHPPHGPTRIMALGEGDRTQTGAWKPGPQGARSLWTRALFPFLPETRVSRSFPSLVSPSGYECARREETWGIEFIKPGSAVITSPSVLPFDPFNNPVIHSKSPG